MFLVLEHKQYVCSNMPLEALANVEHNDGGALAFNVWATEMLNILQCI